MENDDFKDAIEEFALIHKLTTEQQKLFSIKTRNVTIPALTETINPFEKFLDDSKVKYRLGSSFKLLIESSDPFSSLSREILDSSILIQKTEDSQIVPLIGKWKNMLPKEKILYRIIYLTEQQPKGEGGILLVNGHWTNVGYFVNERGLCSVAALEWRATTEEWRCEVFNFENVTWDINEGIITESGVLLSPPALMN